MTKLSEEEKQELLEDAGSEVRRREFAALRKMTEDAVLSPDEFIRFLDWSQKFMTETAKVRPPITGETFLL